MSIEFGDIHKAKTAELQSARFPYGLASPKETAELSGRKTKEIKDGNQHAIPMGAEAEGGLNSNKGLRKVHDNKTVTFEHAPPERYTAQLEVVTGLTPEGTLPSSALEIAQSFAVAVEKGLKIAEMRRGRFVIASVPEQGKPSEIKLTPHEKIRQSYERGQTGIHPHSPQEAKDLCRTAGLKDKKNKAIIPFHATHVHTGNPQLPDGRFDARSAYAAGILELTQLSQVESFILFNTKGLLGKSFEGVKDVRSIIRRTTTGAHDTTIPDNASDFYKAAIQAYDRGDTHDISRFPVRGQHDRVRILKPFGTTESVVGAANPDLRLTLTHIYFKQLMRVLAYKALTETQGDESNVITYLTKEYEGGKYSYLFEVIPTMEGENSCFQQDLKFNKDGFNAQSYNKTYKKQIQDIRSLVRNIGHEFPAFKTQAKIVDHVLGEVMKPPAEIGLSTYLDPESGMKGGIITDHKSDDINQNIHDQATGTEKQTKALLAIHDEKGLLEFMGIKKSQAKTIYIARN